MRHQQGKKTTRKNEQKTPREKNHFIKDPRTKSLASQRKGEKIKMIYNYEENIKEDVKNYIKENYEKEEIKDLDYDDIYDELFLEDTVTGNGSGSYTFSTWQAEENICHNMELAQEAYEYFGYEGVDMSKGAEAVDVTIRCYLLGQVLQDILDELKED